VRGSVCGDFEAQFRFGKPPRARQIQGMEPSFEILVEQVRTRSFEEKEELKFLLERDLVNARRRDIAENHRRAKNEIKRGKVKFSNSVDELKKMLAGE
jgi:hypothetical protein